MFKITMCTIIEFCIKLAILFHTANIYFDFKILTKFSMSYNMWQFLKYASVHCLIQWSLALAGKEDHFTAVYRPGAEI